MDNGHIDLRQRAEIDIVRRGYFVTLARTSEELEKIMDLFSKDHEVKYAPSEGLPGGAAYYLRISPKQKLEEGVQK